MNLNDKFLPASSINVMSHTSNSPTHRFGTDEVSTRVGDIRPPWPLCIQYTWQSWPSSTNAKVNKYYQDALWSQFNSEPRLGAKKLGGHIKLKKIQTVIQMNFGWWSGQALHLRLILQLASERASDSQRKVALETVQLCPPKPWRNLRQARTAQGDHN